VAGDWPEHLPRPVTPRIPEHVRDHRAAEHVRACHNMPGGDLEQNVEWLAGLIQHMTRARWRGAEPAPRRRRTSGLLNHDEVARGHTAARNGPLVGSGENPGKPRTLTAKSVGVGHVRAI